MMLSNWLIFVQLVQFPVRTMNELPAIGYHCYTQTLGSPGGKHRKLLERNVWCNVVSTSEKRILEKEQHSFFRQCFIASRFGQCCYVENISFCLNNREIFDKFTDQLPFFVNNTQLHVFMHDTHHTRDYRFVCENDRFQ